MQTEGLYQPCLHLPLEMWSSEILNSAVEELQLLLCSCRWCEYSVNLQRVEMTECATLMSIVENRDWHLYSVWCHG
jgi:hypothetical protein